MRVSGGRGGDQTIIDRIQVKSLFPENDPFEKFRSLSDLKDSLGIPGVGYRPDIGNFIEFRLPPRHILTYLPDSLRINPRVKDVWLEYFKDGKTINKNWNLRKLPEPMDNG